MDVKIFCLFVCQFSPSGRRASLQVWSFRGHAANQFLLTLWPGSACITRRYSATHLVRVTVLSKRANCNRISVFGECKSLFSLSSGLGMYESPLFLAGHEEDSGGRSVPTTALQVAAPGMCLLLCLTWWDLFSLSAHPTLVSAYSTQSTVSENSQ